MTRESAQSSQLRTGIDLGGSKIAGVVLGPVDRVLAEHRIAAPRHDYDATVRAIGSMVHKLEQDAGGVGSVGIGMPGSVSPRRGCVQNANSTWINGRPFMRDLEAHLQRPLRLANDANCFALSEATDGAAANARSVFGVIIGTGCGGGLVWNANLIDGPRGIAGEWGHNPLPWMRAEEYPGPVCWCGRAGCLETWVSGPGLQADHAKCAGEQITTEQIAAKAAAGDAQARASLERHASRLARGLAHVINIFDPEVIVLGGGLSQLQHLYEELPALVSPYVLVDGAAEVIIRPPRWGDASGVRGAARLWEGAPG